MKRLLTLAAATTLAAASLSAQAQVTLNGSLSAIETNGPATSGDYVLLGQYPYVHGFGDAGLLALFAANSPSKVQMFLAGTIEPKSNNSFQIFIGLPGTTGVASGTALPVPQVNGLATSFDKFSGGKLDQKANLGIAIHTNGTNASTNPQYQIEAVVFTSATVSADTVISATASPVSNSGVVISIGRIGTKSVFSGLSGARFAYLNTTDGKIQSNPGYTAPATAVVTYPLAGYGQAVGTTGWEIELDRTALGLPTGNPVLNLFAQQNNNEGSYVSSDYLPNPVVPGSANSGNLAVPNPDYTAIAGTQSATFTLATVVLATKAADAAAIGLSIFPNPSQGAATVQYAVAERAANVNIVLTDLLGRPVRVLENSLKAVGTQTTPLNTASLAAGSYLVRVQVGERVSTSKVSVL